MHKRRIKSFIAGFIIAGVCLLSFPTAAQRPEPQNKQGKVSDNDFISLNEQIKELKNPIFRAFLRMRILSWESAESGPMRRQAAMEVATLGVTDLCEHQDEVWTPTAWWLHRSFVKQIKTLQSPEETGLKICVLKTETTNNSEKDLSEAIKMLSDPETSAAGLKLAKAAILSGQVSGDTMLGHLVSPKVAQSPYFHELLDTVLSVEEKQPGTLPLRIMPFFTSIFLEKSVSSEMQTRFLFVAVRATRRSGEEFANPAVRGPVTSLLNGIIIPAQRLAPALYPEITSRLGSLSKNALTRAQTRVTAEERIQKANDQLEQLISEANAASDEELKKYFFFRAARLAQEHGQLSKAVDLATKVEADSSWLHSFLSETVLVAVNRKSGQDATYAISKMTRPLEKAKAFCILGDYYGANQDKVNSKEAFTESAKHLKLVVNSKEKVKASVFLAESVLKYEPADAYEVFREAVKVVNNLPSPEKDQEKMYYGGLLPIAEDLIRSFRLLATRQNQTATNLAADIKLPELRLAALTGVSSGHSSGR